MHFRRYRNPNQKPNPENTMATFQRAPEDRQQLVDKVIAECYPDLVVLMGEENRFPVTFDLLDVFADQDANGEPKGAAIKHHGRAVQADIRIVPKADRALGRADVLLRFDGDAWPDLPEDEQEALIDHELRHLNPLKTKDEQWKKDDLGRQMFALHEHDIEVGWFLDVAQRRKAASIEVKQATRIADKWGQFLFFFGDTQPLPLKSGKRGAKPEAAPAPPAPEEASREWRLWEQLTPDEQEYATEVLGDRFDATMQFRVVVGSLCDQQPLENSAPPANEQEAAPEKKSRARKTAAKGGKGQ